MQLEYHLLLLFKLKSHCSLEFVSRLYETGVAFKFLGRGGGFGFVGGVFPRETGCDVDDLGGCGGGGGFFWGTSPLSRTFLKHCNPLRAVSLEFGSLFQHDVMTCCQISHGWYVPLM